MFHGRLGLFEFRHVARDADDARDMAILIVNGYFSHRGPYRTAVQIRLLLKLVDQRRARQDDPLLVFVKLPRLFLGMKIEIRFANNLSWIIEPEAVRHRVTA